MLRPSTERMRVLHAQAKRPKPEPIAAAEVTALIYALARQVDELRAQVRDLRDEVRRLSENLTPTQNHSNPVVDYSMISDA